MEVKSMVIKSKQSTVRVNPKTKEAIGRIQEQTDLSQPVILDKAVELLEHVLREEQITADFLALAQDPQALKAYRGTTAHLDNTAGDGLRVE